MEDFEWHDPLLITDASSSLEHNQIPTQPHCESPTSCSLGDSVMEENPHVSSPSQIDGRSALGFSLTSPDLVICMGSPDIVANQTLEESPGLTEDERFDVTLDNEIQGSEIRDLFETTTEQDSPGFLEDERINVSLENGIEGPEIRDLFEAMTEDFCAEASFELVAPQMVEDSSTEDSTSEMNVNVGSTGVVSRDGIQFSEDFSFDGGDVIRTEDDIIGDEEGLGLYQTARFGNFSYHFKNLESGSYVIDLHFAEIVFTNGPPGMRIFDVFVQDEKAISSLDIYERVGANVPLVISDIRTQVTREEGLSVRFEGVIGSAIVCGISMRRVGSGSFGEAELSEGTAWTYMEQCESLKVPLIHEASDVESCSVDGELRRLQMEHESHMKELLETRMALVELKKENESKNRECKEALKSLKELQNELMRKSMHVGSLAFAIEGQVKEKSKWFNILRDLTRKLKLLKMDHISLSKEASLFKQYLEDAENVNSTVLSTMNQQAQLHEDIKDKFLKEARERKELYNKVLDLKGNIRVFCRCRPLNGEEITAGGSMAVEFEAAKDGELTVRSNGIPKKTFKFDAVFTPEADQVEVFEETAPLASSVLDGYNVCIFAYGQTGTGKTFTMEGINNARGVNYRTLEKLFHIIEERKNTFRYEVTVSVLEVYNEQIRDLLVSNSQPGANTKRLEVKQVGEGGGHHVPGLVEARVNDVDEVWDVLRTGSNARAIGSTNANEHSSRSHCMHCVMVKGENLLNGESTRSKLWLVDLAGSERIAKTEVQGERLKETQNINRSLSALGDVISALSTRSSHIPFRNSKLTHLLQDSLGGDSKTLMFVQISPNENDVTETLCSLNFASRVRGIELGPAKKQMDNSELLKYKQMVEKLKQDLKSKDNQVKKMEDSNYGLEVKIKERDVKNRNLQDKIKELESQLLVERKLARQHVESRIAEQRQETKLQHEEQKFEPVRAPLSSKILGESNKFSFRPPFMDGNVRVSDSTEKENNPGMAEQTFVPKRNGRASLCPTFQRIMPSSTAPRRNSLIPMPTLTAKLPSSFMPLAPIRADKSEADDDEGSKITCLPEHIRCDSPKEHKNATKKPTFLPRRSIHKKSLLKSPLQHRRVGVNVGMERVRVSIGGRTRLGQRTYLGNAKRVVPRDNNNNNTLLQKQNHREKERGWNIGSVAARTLL